MRVGTKGPGEKAQKSSCDSLTSLPHFQSGDGRCVFVLMAFSFFFISVFQRNSTKPKADRKMGSSIQAQGHGYNYFTAIYVAPQETFCHAHKANPEDIMAEGVWLLVALGYPCPQTPSAGTNKALPTSQQSQVPEKSAT